MSETNSRIDRISRINLMICHSLYTIISIFVDTFLSAHIYKLTDSIFDYIFNVSLFEMVACVAIVIFYYIFSVLISKIKSVNVYRIGCVLKAGVVIITIFFGEKLANVLVLAGILNGLGSAGYYCGYNSLKQEKVTISTSKLYVGIMNGLTKLVKIVCPVLLGALIDISTFSMVAVYVLLICCIQLICTIFIRFKDKVKYQYNLRNFFKEAKGNENFSKELKSFYTISIFNAFDRVLKLLLTICIMIYFGTNLSLGAISSIIAGVQVVVMIVFIRFTREGKRGVIFAINSLLPLVSAILFVAMPSMITIVIYNLTFALGDIIFRSVFDVNRNNILKEHNMQKYFTEFESILEMLFNFVRATALLILILLSKLGNTVIFFVVFVLFASTMMVEFILLHRHEKKFIQNLKEEMPNNDMQEDK